MGDRFYAQQKNYKPKRRLKRDIVMEVEAILGQQVEGLDKLTIKTLDDLKMAIAFRISQAKFSGAYRELAQ
jgi:hypothetical protein